MCFDKHLAYRTKHVTVSTMDEVVLMVCTPSVTVSSVPAVVFPVRCLSCVSHPKEFVTNKGYQDQNLCEQ